MPGLGAFLFRHRGLVPVLPIAAAIWFAEPTSAGVACGLILMITGEAVRLWGAAHLGSLVRSSRPRVDRLVTTGPYAHTRHPLYWGNLLLTLGYVIVTGAWWPWFMLLVLVGFVVLYASHARREERALSSAYPQEHAVYRTRVPAWFWRPTPAPPVTTGIPDWRSAWRIEALSINAEFWILAAVWARVEWRF